MCCGHHFYLFSNVLFIFCYIHRGIEACKETNRENDKHSFDFASSGISPKTFSLSVNTLEVHLYTVIFFHG